MCYTPASLSRSFINQLQVVSEAFIVGFSTSFREVLLSFVCQSELQDIRLLQQGH